MSLKSNIEKIENVLDGTSANLIIVTKTRPLEKLIDLYSIGYKVFGENRVQELVEKYEHLPKDIEWHLIGHLQTNKVKYIAAFVHTIHSVESFKLLQEINKQAQKHNRVVNCLLQIYIAKEESKFGLSETEALEILNHSELPSMRNVLIKGVMGMATNTSDNEVVKREFKSLKSFFEQIKNIKKDNVSLTEISMGMSNDYPLAVAEGSTLVRVGSAVFVD
jgi:hypothetical protein